MWISWPLVRSFTEYAPCMQASVQQPAWSLHMPARWAMCSAARQGPASSSVYVCFYTVTGCSMFCLVGVLSCIGTATMVTARLGKCLLYSCVSFSDVMDNSPRQGQLVKAGVLQIVYVGCFPQKPAGGVQHETADAAPTSASKLD